MQIGKMKLWHASLQLLAGNIKRISEIKTSREIILRFYRQKLHNPIIKLSTRDPHANYHKLVKTYFTSRYSQQLKKSTSIFHYILFKFLVALKQGVPTIRHLKMGLYRRQYCKKKSDVYLTWGNYENRKLKS